MDNDWRNAFSTTERAAFINKLIMMLEMCIPNSDKAMIRAAATSFERGAYRIANNKQEYVQQFVQKFEELKSRFKGTNNNSSEKNPNTYLQNPNTQSVPLNSNNPGLIPQFNAQDPSRAPDFNPNYNSTNNTHFAANNLSNNINNQTRFEPNLAEAIKNLQGTDTNKKVPASISSALVMNYLQQQHQSLSQNPFDNGNNQSTNNETQLMQKIKKLQQLQNQQLSGQLQHPNLQNFNTTNNTNNVENSLKINQTSQNNTYQLNNSTTPLGSDNQPFLQSNQNNTTVNQSLNSNPNFSNQLKAKPKDLSKKRKVSTKKPSLKKPNTKNIPSSSLKLPTSPISLASSNNHINDAYPIINQGASTSRNIGFNQPSDNLNTNINDTINSREDNISPSSDAKNNEKSNPRSDLSNIPMNKIFNINVNNRKVGLSLQQIIQMRLVTQQKNDPNMSEQFSSLLKHFITQAQAQMQLEGGASKEIEPKSNTDLANNQQPTFDNSNSQTSLLINNSQSAQFDNPKITSTAKTNDQAINQGQDSYISNSFNEVSSHGNILTNRNIKSPLIDHKLTYNPLSNFNLDKQNNESSNFINNQDLLTNSLNPRNLSASIENTLKNNQNNQNTSNIETNNDLQHQIKNSLLDPSILSIKQNQISANDAYKVINILEQQIQKLHIKKTPINVNKEEQAKIRQILPILEVMFSQVQKVLPIVYIWNHDEKAMARILTMKVMFKDQLESTKLAMESQVNFEKLRKIQPTDLTSQSALERFQLATQKVVSDIRNEFLLSYSELDLIRTQLINLINQVKAEASLNNSMKSAHSNTSDKTKETLNTENELATNQPIEDSTLKLSPSRSRSSSSDSTDIPISVQINDKAFNKIDKNQEDDVNNLATIGKDKNGDKTVTNDPTSKKKSRKRSHSIGSTASDVQSISSDSSGDDIPLLKKHALLNKNNAMPISPFTKKKSETNMSNLLPNSPNDQNPNLVKSNAGNGTIKPPLSNVHTNKDSNQESIDFLDVNLASNDGKFPKITLPNSESTEYSDKAGSLITGLENIDKQLLSLLSLKDDIDLNSFINASGIKLPKFTDNDYHGYWNENKDKCPLLYLQQSKQKLDSSTKLDNLDTEIKLFKFVESISSSDSISLYNSTDTQFPSALFSDFF
ncbi:hypothetical protein BB561_005752 [Smittium simulii]|uniref:Mediator complex subunit 15 KIX domain-containing protein n=1 Tax=Smittium simulii TaxID=133385 RepID=A0A2T9Y8M2_9FUNG|nr:hypothetical protein BB561_005752 [Smittium simulii]